MTHKSSHGSTFLTFGEASITHPNSPTTLTVFLTISLSSFHLQNHQCYSSMESPFLILIPFLFSFYASITYSIATNTITVNQTIRDGQTIVSPQQSFELGFYSPTTATRNRYLGIWYKRLATGTVAWVANRETPITNKSGELTLRPDGVLVLRDSTTDTIVWSSLYPTTETAQNPIAQLLDSGNLMVVDRDDPYDYVWQSFDYPGNTYLPGIKFGRNLKKGVVTNFTSWKTDDDPSKGEHMVYMDFNGVPQIYQNKGDVIHMRLGSWNGFSYTGQPNLKPNSIFTFEQVSNESEIYYKFELINRSNLIKMMITSAGDLFRLNWNNRVQEWSLFSASEVDKCSQYALCGPYASCDTEQFPACGCLKGFIPKNPQQWDAADWTSGCRREIPLDCGVGEGYRRYWSMKLPDTRNSWFDREMSLEQCRVRCKNECNCSAYSTLDIRVNLGCILWYGELVDLRSFPNIGQDIYIRMTAAELEKDKKTSSSSKNLKIIVILVVVGLTVLLGLLVLMIIRKRKLKQQGRDDPIAKDKEESQIYESQNDNLHDLPLFSLSTLLDATNNFSNGNKIGEGGFGPVYKGFLEDGREIAVKRLSESSTQGVEEFKNEVLFISKLQHRNLVKILGCCIEGQEKTLVYEYMPNKGLDLFLFQEAKRKTLNWTQRFHIINGIARGLLYLHQDSRLRIIHRDLKASNILLDDEMNPKISDFGMARSFGGNDTETNTKRVVGTYGYMSPEYAGSGIFSVKSDVFSFGVLVLEIVSGKKNKGFFHPTQSHNLLEHAWRLYNEGNILELVEASLIESSAKWCDFQGRRLNNS
ncbi:hypothetical protein L6452_00303 [Arctium lappa]|uniref:Uncharacterized protein n=1 Tax=Arctium lappa TaxID=4217 RepID=A0ACB9FEH7_ARCLA|nr:hypothetical protein L6452_00303 [Arctium lappa]